MKTPEINILQKRGTRPTAHLPVCVCQNLRPRTSDIVYSKLQADKSQCIGKLCILQAPTREKQFPYKNFHFENQRVLHIDHKVFIFILHHFTILNTIHKISVFNTNYFNSQLIGAFPHCSVALTPSLFECLCECHMWPSPLTRVPLRVPHVALTVDSSATCASYR